MTRRALARACLVSFGLGVALGVPAVGSAGGHGSGKEGKQVQPSWSSQATLVSPVATEPLGRKAK